MDDTNERTNRHHACEYYIENICFLFQLVEALSCKDVRVGKTSGQIIAKIGNMEIPKKVWNGLIPGLVQLAITQPAAQEAALSTLGFLCDDLGNEHVTPELTNKMLNAIIKGYNNPAPAIVFAASIALKNSLTFIERNFEMKPHRDKIMQTLLQKGCLHSVEKVRLQNLQTLVEVVELYYNRMPPYFDAARTVTFRAIKQFRASADVSCGAFSRNGVPIALIHSYCLVFASSVPSTALNFGIFSPKSRKILPSRPLRLPGAVSHLMKLIKTTNLSCETWIH